MTREQELRKPKLLWKGTIGEAVKLGKMTQKEADEMLKDYSDEEQEAFDDGKEEGRTEKTKEILQMLDYFKREWKKRDKPNNTKEIQIGVQATILAIEKIEAKIQIPISRDRQGSEKLSARKGRRQNERLISK